LLLVFEVVVEAEVEEIFEVDEEEREGPALMDQLQQPNRVTSRQEAEEVTGGVVDEAFSQV
jgi:hypothetical protein